MTEKGSRTQYGCSVIPIVDVVSIVSPLLAEYQIVDTFLTFTYLRVLLARHSWVNVDGWVFPSLIINRSTRQLLRIGTLVLAFAVVMSCTVMTLERAGDLDSFDSLVGNPSSYTLWNSLYFTTITVTTVGYGDITPKTALGRAATVLFLIAGARRAAYQLLCGCR